jgi:hypothetical protein
MKLVRTFLFIFIAYFLLINMNKNNYSSLFAKELPAKKFTYPFLYQPKEIAPANLSNKFNLKFRNKISIQSVNFRILDSLMNAYSYFTDSQQPFVYERNTNTLITIKRGYFDLDTTPTYSGTNTKDNLFLLKSKDLGQTWTAPVLLFDSKKDATPAGSYGTARYPSIFGFLYSDSLTVVFTAPTNNAAGWIGYVNGLYDGPDKIASFNGSFNIQGQNYGWAGTESKILGGLFNGTDPFGIAVGGIMPPGGTQWSNNSNIAYRKTTTFDTWNPTIPPEWASSVFQPVTQDSTRSCSVVDLKYGLNNKMYLAVVGNFVSQTPSNRVKVGVSTSTDLGNTWSDFIVSSNQLLTDYVTSLGFDPDSVYMDYSSKGFVVFDNGDFSFAVTLYDGAIAGVSQPDTLQLKQIVELFYEGGNWGIRKIANVSGFVLAYLPSTATNQMGYELQLSRTLDGNRLLSKWVDFTDYVNPQTGQITKYYTTDIYVSARNKNNSNWGVPLNITKSDIYDRITWIPDYLPNNLNNVPVLKVETEPNLSDDSVTARNRQRYLQEYPQYVMIGNFDVVTGVQESSETNSNLSFTSISPNPAETGTDVNFNLTTDGTINMTLYNVMGQPVRQMFNGFASLGIHSVHLNTAGLASGTYYCTLTAGGNKATEMITIIK